MDYLMVKSSEELLRNFHYSKRGSFSCSNNPLFHEFGRSLQLSMYKIIAMIQYFLLKWIILLGLVVPPNLRPPNSLSLQMHGFIWNESFLFLKTSNSQIYREKTLPILGFSYYTTVNCEENRSRFQIHWKFMVPKNLNWEVTIYNLRNLHFTVVK